jgi:mono/diheme cytochrome c family protein
LLLAMLLLACQPPPDGRAAMPGTDAAAGLETMRRAGCGACHRIPGLEWPRGGLGPSLDGFAGQALIAGRLPNQPDTLAAYVRNAPALTPGTTMPAMPISEKEARDVAAYLYTLAAD